MNDSEWQTFLCQLKQTVVQEPTLFPLKKVAPKTILLQEGDVATCVYLIKRGALRLWHNDEGKEITVQFFFEEQAVASFESFYLAKPSEFSIEGIEETEVWVLHQQALNQFMQQYPDSHALFTQLVAARFIAYTKYFLSRIKESPEARYRQLLTQEPQVIARVPQVYIASYFGITPVSLSRIRHRIAQKND